MLESTTGRGEWPARVMPVLPLVTVTVFAGFGQVLAGVDAYTPGGWPTPLRVLVAVGIAIGLEMIAVYVQWHAHDALLLKATATAARLRRVSYLIAGAVAAFQYSHFAAAWTPTPSAVVFAAFSASSPWLWGLHTRRAQHLQLLREGHADAGGATFSAERWRAFPFRTWAARRWSIDHSVTDPRAAWEGYRAAAAARTDPLVEDPAEPGIQTVADLVAERATEPERAPLRLAPEPPNTTPTPPAGTPAVKKVSPARTRPATSRARVVAPDLAEKAAPLIAQDYGRQQLADALGVKPHVARQLLEAHRASR